MSVGFESLASAHGWAHRLGLLPVPLYPRPQGPEYVMLNGDRGNFCLTFAPVIDDPRSVTWSCDVGHHVEVTETRAVIRKWDGSQPETIPLATIENDLERFRRYLEHTDPRLVETVVGHVMKCLHVLRDALTEAERADDAVIALLTALAARSDQVSPQAVDLKRWDLEEYEPAMKRIPAGTWNSVMRLLQEPTIEGLSVHPTLLLRHASGRLFQEASYRVSLPPQMYLPGVEDAREMSSYGAAASQRGQYSTPTRLARTLVEQSLRTLNKHAGGVVVLDPACGSGSLLREVVRQVAHRDDNPAISAYGFDISPTACAMTRFVLRAEQLQNPELNLKYDVKTLDALVTAWPRADVIVMNPPFVSYASMPATEREQLGSLLGMKAAARFDASMFFMAKAAEVLADKGAIGAFVPSATLYGRSGQWLRENFMQSLAPRLVAALGNQYAFKNALVDANVFVAAKTAVTPAEKTTFVWADHRPSSMLEALRQLRKNPTADIEADDHSFSVYQRHSTIAELPAPRLLSALQALEQFGALPTVSEYFDVQMGARPGDNKAFVLDANAYGALPRGERKYFMPALVNASIAEGEIVSSRFLFYPYGDYDIASERELKDVVPQYYETYLKPSKKALRQRKRAHAKKWWLLSEPCINVCTYGPKLVSTFFGSAGSFAWDERGRYAIVQGHGWLPTDQYRDAFTQRTALAYLALLNSDLFETLVRAKSTHLAGGQADLSKRYVKDLPLPNLFGESGPVQAIGELFSSLVKIGKSMSGGRDYSHSLLEDTVQLVYEHAARAHMT